MEKSDNKLAKRLLTSLIVAIVYAGTILLALLVHSSFYDIFVLFATIAAALEVSRAVSQRFGKPMNILLVGNIVIGYWAFYLVHNQFGKGSGGITAAFGVLALTIVFAIVYNMFSKKNTMKNVTSTLFVLIYPITLMIYMLALNYLPEPYKTSSILLIFLVPVCTDTFAYIIGSLIKGPKLIPAVSPKKTISGAIGGLVGGMAAGALVLLFSITGFLGVQPIGRFLWTNISHFLVLGLLGSLFDQIGDLIASYIKRFCNIKDYGNLLPGHGGVMDRIDGMIITAVFMYIYMSVLAIL